MLQTRKLDNENRKTKFEELYLFDITRVGFNWVNLCSKTECSLTAEFVITEFHYIQLNLKWQVL